MIPTWFQKWLGRESPGKNPKNRRTRHPTRRRVKLHAEHLEDRLLPANPAFGFALDIGSPYNVFGQGPTGSVQGVAVAADAQANVYVTGLFQGTIDFNPVVYAPTNLTSSGSSNNAFVAKYTSTGVLVWAADLGAGSGFTVGQGIAVDGSGNVYTTGFFYGTGNFDPNGVHNLTSSGENAYVSKLDSTGHYVWAADLGAGGGAVANAIAVDGTGNVYTTGYFNGTGSAYVSKLDSSGNYVWVVNLGAGSGFTDGQGIAVDGSGNVYTTGYFLGTGNFDPNGTQNLSSPDDYNAYVSKLDSTGNYVWAGDLGAASSVTIGYGIAVDRSSNVYTTGYFQGTGNFDPNATHNLMSAGPGDNAYVSKLDSNGNYLWAADLGGGNGSTVGRSIAVDGAGNIYTTGRLNGTGNFDPNATHNLTSHGSGANPYVSKLDSTGNYVWAVDVGFWAGTSGIVGYGIAVDAASAIVYTTGGIASSQDAFLSQLIQTTTTTGLNASPNPSLYGQPVTFTATVSGTPTGTVQFVIDGSNYGSPVALAGGSASVSDAALSVGAHTVTAIYSGDPNFSPSTGTLSGGQTVQGAQFLVSVPGTTVAGQNFLVTVREEDQNGYPLTGYSGPVNFTTTDPQVPTLAGGTLTNGSGSFLGVLKMVVGGPWTITATAPFITGTSSSITVTPSFVVHFLVSAPSTATTGSPIAVTVTAQDNYGNIASNYSGTVQLSCTDATVAVINYPFTTGAGQDNGVHTFNVTLNTGGTQKSTAIDFGDLLFGISGPIVVRGLVVTSLIPTPTGFVATFSKPIDPSKINLYDVTLASLVAIPGFEIPGSVLLSNNNQTLTFVGTNRELADDTYSLDLTSSANPSPWGGAAGFQDLSGIPLDGANNAGIADYTTTFSTSFNSAGLTVAVPSFARGPGQPVNVDLINFHHGTSSAGIPIQLTGIGTAQTVSFTLSYNASLLTITPVSNATSAVGTYSVATLGSGPGATATFTFTASSPLTLTAGDDPVTLGQLTGSVPSVAAYKSKGLLHIVNPLILDNNNQPVNTVGQDGVQVVAFLGDASGLGSYSPLDASLMSNVEVVQQNGGNLALPAFPLSDPDLIAGIDGAIDPNTISQELQTNLGKSVPGLPAYTGAPSNNPTGPDPALSIPTELEVSAGGTVSVPVNIDDPHPAGSTGLMLATLALTYDPKEFSVSAQDIHLGTVPRAGTGWILAAPVVDAGKGQIGITLYSLTPISAATAGSLVTIDLHFHAGASGGASPIQLVPAVDVGGQEIETALADSQGLLALHQAPASAVFTGLDGELVTATHAAPDGGTDFAPAVWVLPRPMETAPETAASILSAMAGEEDGGPEGAHAGARPITGAPFFVRPSAGANLILAVGAVLAAGGLPLPNLGKPTMARLLDEVLVAEAHALAAPAMPSSLEALIWDARDTGPAMPAGTATDRADFDYRALDTYFAQDGDELQ